MPQKLEQRKLQKQFQQTNHGLRIRIIDYREFYLIILLLTNCNFYPIKYFRA